MNKSHLKTVLVASLQCATVTALSGCAVPVPRNLSIPSLDYANRAKAEYASDNPEYRAQLAQKALRSNPPPQAQFVSDELNPPPPPNEAPSVVTNLGPNVMPPEGSFTVQESTRPSIRDYTGPLSLGNPGVSSSLWRETQGVNLVRDVRAFQPMDLITIQVAENAEGKRQADTTVKQSSTLSASISSLLGIDDKIIAANPSIVNGSNTDLTDALKTEFASDFKGEGDTTRKGSLKGKISAMVVEVLPSGILRIEGQKILAVNNEDEIMVISGLVRPEDVSSANEVSSGKVANMRIDYFGQGTVGDAQVGGWMSRILRRLWPF